MYRKYDYIMNEYQTNTRKPRHKARISIAILEKESKAIARSNDTESNIIELPRKVTLYVSDTNTLRYLKKKASTKNKTKKKRYYPH